MTGIGGPSGIGGPKGPEGPSGPDGPDGADRAASARGADGAAGADAAGATDLRALAAEVEAGRMSKEAALDRLLDDTLAPELDAADRAELRDMVRELIANDPYLVGVFGE
jgi:hypothetical protein